MILAKTVRYFKIQITQVFTNLDSYLSSRHQSTKSVVIHIETDKPVQVDLNKLPMQMQVYITCFGEYNEPDPDTNPDTDPTIESMARKSKMVKRMNQALYLLLQKPVKHPKLKAEETTTSLENCRWNKRKSVFFIFLNNVCWQCLSTVVCSLFVDSCVLTCCYQCVVDKVVRNHCVLDGF